MTNRTHHHTRNIAPGIAIALSLLAGLAPASMAAVGDGATTTDAAQLTPVGMRVIAAPVPVKGSDGFFHVVYEIEVTNFMPNRVRLQLLEVLDARRGGIAAALDAQEIAGRLAVNDPNATPGTLGVAQAGLLYMHLGHGAAAPAARPADGPVDRRLAPLSALRPARWPA